MLLMADSALLSKVLLLVLCLVLFIRNPDLAIAVQFSGTIIYFYVLFKLGIEPFRLLTGGFHAFLIVSYLVGGVVLMVKNRNAFRPGIIDILFVGFFLWVFLSYFIFFNGNEAAYVKIMFAPFLVIAPYFGIQLLSSEKKIKRFLDFCVVLPVVLIIPSLYEMFFNPFFAGVVRFAPFAFEDKQINPHVFATAYAVMALILLIRFFEGGIKYRKTINVVLIFISIYFVLRSGARSQLLNLVLVMSFYIMLVSKIRLKHKFYLGAFVCLMFVLAYLFVPESMFMYYASTLHYEDLQVSSVAQRIKAYEAAFKDYIGNPILGVGMGNSIRGISFPHNIILEVAAELGTFGLLVFLLLCYLTVRKALIFIKDQNNGESRTLMKTSLVLFVYSLGVLMFSERLVTAIWFFVPMGIISFLSKQNNKGKNVSGAGPPPATSKEVQTTNRGR